MLQGSGGGRGIRTPRGLSDPNCFQDSLVMTASICLRVLNYQKPSIQVKEICEKTARKASRKVHQKMRKTQ